MRPILLALCGVLVLGLFTACGEEERFRANPGSETDPDELILRKDIANLAAGAKTSDPEASVIYDKAVNDLILRGSKIETRLIDTLRSHPDAWTRIGCIEVLGATGTKTSVEHLIAVLDDSEPLVAFRANKALQVLTDKRMIAESGVGDPKLLPAVPVRPDSDKALDAEERMWATWHATHKAELKAAWERWWVANRATTTLK